VSESHKDTWLYISNLVQLGKVDVPSHADIRSGNSLHNLLIERETPSHPSLVVLIAYAYSLTTCVRAVRGTRCDFAAILSWVLSVTIRGSIRPANATAILYSLD
jgi:hypothetical protein